MTEAQIEELNLPSRPTKKSDSRSKGFEGESVELDAIPPHELRELVRDAVELHVDERELRVLQIAEAEERKVMERIADTLNGADEAYD